VVVASKTKTFRLRNIFRNTPFNFRLLSIDYTHLQLKCTFTKKFWISIPLLQSFCLLFFLIARWHRSSVDRNWNSGKSGRFYNSFHVLHRGHTTEETFIQRKNRSSAVYESFSQSSLVLHPGYIGDCLNCCVCNKLLQSLWIQRREWSRNVWGIQLF